MIFELGNKRLTGDGKYWIAPSANVIGDVTLKNDSSIWFNVVIRGDIENITVGEGSNVQDNSVLHTDYGVPLKIGKMVTVGHLVMLHGCTIMDNSLIGIGSTILNKSAEGKIIPDNSLVMGSPGKVIRQITEEEKKAITENAQRYIDNWKKYVKDLKKI